MLCCGTTAIDKLLSALVIDRNVIDGDDPFLTYLNQVKNGHLFCIKHTSVRARARSNLNNLLNTLAMQLIIMFPYFVQVNTRGFEPAQYNTYNTQN